MAQVQAKILDIKALGTLRISFEFIENNESRKEDNLFFLDQTNGTIYDFEGPVDAKLQEAIHAWIAKKQEAVMDKMLRATPEQLAAMGIDLKDKDLGKNGKLILPGR